MKYDDMLHVGKNNIESYITHYSDVTSAQFSFWYFRFCFYREIWLLLPVVSDKNLSLWRSHSNITMEISQ